MQWCTIFFVFEVIAAHLLFYMWSERPLMDCSHVFFYRNYIYISNETRYTACGCDSEWSCVVDTEQICMDKVLVIKVGVVWTMVAISIIAQYVIKKFRTNPDSNTSILSNASSTLIDLGEHVSLSTTARKFIIVGDSNTECYCPTSNTWSMFTNINCEFSKICSVFLGTELYILGGWCPKQTQAVNLVSFI